MAYKYDFADPKWSWRIIVKRILFDDSMGIPKVKHLGILAIIYTTTESQYDEVELLYTLTTPQSVLQRALKLEPDGYYQLVIEKESVASKLYRTTRTDKKRSLLRYGVKGHCIISKHKDVIFWHNKYFQIGNLNPLNIQERDPQEEVRRGSWRKNPNYHNVPVNW